MTLTPKHGDRIVYGDGSTLALDLAVLGYDNNTWCVVNEQRRGWIVCPFPEMDIALQTIFANVNLRAWRTLRWRVARWREGMTAPDVAILGTTK